MEILICTDGSGTSIQSAELISKIGFPAINRIRMLGVSEDESDVEMLNNSMDVMEKQLGGKYSISRKIRYGNPTDEILAEALDYPYDLVAVGGGGRQLGLLHPKLGSTASKLVRKLDTHFLVARNIPKRIGKILVCVGPEASYSETITVGGAWIVNTSAEISLLHVTAAMKELNRNGQPSSSMNIGPSDVILVRANRQLRKAGVKSDIVSCVRQGLVVDEALAELSEGNYDLLVVGAHYQPGQDRWQETLLDDVTDQLLNRSTCSVLII